MGSGGVFLVGAFFSIVRREIGKGGRQIGCATIILLPLPNYNFSKFFLTFLVIPAFKTDILF